MDRNTVTGLLLIFAITIAWAWFTMPSEEELAQRQAEQAAQDSIAVAQAEQEPDSMMAVDGDSSSNQPLQTGQDAAGSQTGQGTIAETQTVQNLGLFSAANFPDTVLTTVQTEEFQIEMTNVGAGPSKIALMEHETWEHNPVQMIRDVSRSAYSLGFLSSQNHNIETQNLVFEPLTENRSIEISADESAEVGYRLNLGNGSELIFIYTFYGDVYTYDLDIQFVNMEQYISGTNVDFGWYSALSLTEQDATKDAQATAAYVFAGGELEKFQVPEAEQTEHRINGTIEWISTRSRFFGQFIQPVSGSNAAILRGEEITTGGLPEMYYRYTSAIQSNYTQNQELSYELYAGPLRYYDLKDYNEHAYDVIEIGYAIFRWFADPLVRYLIIPFFAFGSAFIPNYGVLIILFGVIVKLVLFPLTQKSYKSMAGMKELQPKMKEIQEKYADDPQKQQKETIALYRKAGVNPIGGCLPMLLQFPILITLFYFFQNSMIIRQESFLWAQDLSAPDYIIHLPFSLPVLGDQIAGFVLLMSVAMFFQSKISGGMSGGGAPSGGPNMKGFMYMMPVIMLVVFNNFAAGLSLYYLVYNVLSIAQQAYINRTISSDSDDGGSKKGKK